MPTKPPKYFDTFSTMRSDSAIVVAPLDSRGPPKERGQYSRDTAWRYADNRNQEEAVDHQVEPWGISSQELGGLTKGLDDERTQERREQGSRSPNDGRKQCVD